MAVDIDISEVEPLVDKLDAKLLELPNCVAVGSRVAVRASVLMTGVG